MHYTYDGNKLKKVVDVLQNAWLYDYVGPDDKPLMRTETDAEGRVTTIDYLRRPPGFE